jgi:glutathione S-transferase
MPETLPLVLYMSAHWDSPWDCSSWVALREKQVPFATSIAILREGQGVLPALKEAIVAARIPALQHGEFWLSESVAIVEYLEEVFPPPRYPPLLPADPRHRARARQLMLYLRTDCEALRRDRPAWTMFYPAEHAPLAPDAQRTAEELVDTTERLVHRHAPFVCKDFSIADVDLAFALMRLIRSGYDVPPSVREYADRIWSRPSVREFVTHTRPPNPP